MRNSELLSVRDGAGLRAGIRRPLRREPRHGHRVVAATRLIQHFPSTGLEQLAETARVAFLTQLVSRRRPTPLQLRAAVEIRDAPVRSLPCLAAPLLADGIIWTKQSR